jgi:hypothetical protein
MLIIFFFKGEKMEKKYIRLYEIIDEKITYFLK